MFIMVNVNVIARLRINSRAVLEEVFQQIQNGDQFNDEKDLRQGCN